MADGLCTEDTVGNQFEKTLVKDYTNIVKCVNTNSVNDTACENVKSFYIDSDSGKLCGKLCCVKGLEAKHEGFLDMPCSPADDDCRKKRCADRYDSSESSDSGVAVLSCTDCSTYSGGSTGSSASDITEPGSPFSTASSHSEDSSSQPQPPRSAPSHTVHHPPWPWSKSPSPPLKRLSATSATTTTPASTPPPQPGGKRQRTDTLPAPTANAKTKQISNNNNNNNNNTKRFADAAAAVSFVMGGKIQQGKITEYFKSQMKTNSGGIAKPAAQPPQGYFTLLDGSKVLLGSRCAKIPPDIYRKLDVRTLTVASPVKKVVLDTKTKKISQVIAVPRGGARGKTDVVAYLHNHNLNLKVSSTVVPIVKLNNMPSKLNGSNINHNVTSLSVETALPTVPAAVAKPKPTPQPLVSPPKKSPPSSPLTPSTTLSTLPVSASSGGGGVGGGGLGSGGGGNSTKSEASTPGDSDSGVSVRDTLTVSVGASSTTTVPPDVEPQKSPILSQPKTIRFPAKQTQVQRTDPAESGLCRWAECQAQFDTSGALLEHLQIKHVISQATQEHYVCLWVGCKVHGRTSCSRSWLERHVLGHAGNKPFRCIVDGCGCRFSSQQALEKHVNSHFNATENGSNGSARKSLESGNSKLFKRNGKKLRYRRQPWSARMFDYFDAGIMEGLQYRLVTMTTQRTAGEACNKAPGDAVTLNARVLARRVEPDGSRKVLLRWHPPDVIPDEWVPESESTSTRTVSIPTLEPSALDALRSSLFPQLTSSSASHTQKHRRKRVASAKSS